MGCYYRRCYCWDYLYNVSSGDIDETGTWRFWAGVTWSDGDFAPGEGLSVKIYEQGD